MASTNKTTHYELSQYVSSDKPTYLSDYNGDMLKIDTAINTAKTTADSKQQNDLFVTKIPPKQVILQLLRLKVTTNNTSF